MNSASMCQDLQQQQEARILLERQLWAEQREKLLHRRREAAVRAKQLVEAKHEAVLSSLHDDAWRTQKMQQQQMQRQAQRVATTRVAQTHAIEQVQQRRLNVVAHQHAQFEQSVQRVLSAAEKHSVAVQMRAISAAAKTRLSHAQAMERRSHILEQREARREQIIAEQERQQQQTALQDAAVVGAASLRRPLSGSYLTVNQRVKQNSVAILEMRREQLEKRIAAERLRAEAVSVVKSNELAKKREEMRAKERAASARVLQVEQQKRARRMALEQHAGATSSVAERVREHNRSIPRVASLSRYTGFSPPSVVAEAQEPQHQRPCSA